MSIRLTIFNKGLFLVAIPLLWQLLFIFLVFEMLQGNSEVQGWVTHTKEVIAQSHIVQGTLSGAEASVRGLTVTGDPAFAEEYERAAKRLPEELASLQKLVADNPEQTARVADASEKAARFIAWLADTTRLVSQGALDRAAIRTRSRDGEILMEDCHRAITAFLNEEERLEAERRLKVERSQRQLQMLLFGGSAVTILLTLLLAFSFHRGIGRRFAILTENAQRLAQRRELLPPITGADEIVQVDCSFHRMAEQLAKSENALREQKQILQSVLESMADGVVVANTMGKFLLFNPAAEQILGTGMTDAPPDNWAERYGVYLADKQTLYPPEQLPLVKAICGETVDDAELWIRHPSIPEGAWIHANARPLRGPDGVLRGGVVVFRDVSQHKQLEAALRESEKRFRQLVEGVQDYAIFMLDPEGRVASWNAGAERFKGYQAEEILGKHFSCFYPEEMKERGWPQTELQLARSQGRSQDEGWRVRKDGSRFWASVVITAIHDESGRLCGFAKLTRDLSEQKKAEEAIRQLNAELEQRVRERTASLSQANRDLAQKNQENELFVYSVSHDLRSPLVNLEGFSEELGLVCRDVRHLLAESELPSGVRDRVLALLDGDMSESIRFIRAGVRRLSHIIDGLLRLSRAGRVEHHCRRVEIKPIILRIVDSLHATIVEQKATVTVADLPPVWADPAAVEQIFANLIANALNYLAPSRPGVIEIGTVDAPGKAKANNSQSSLQTFYVKDNGLGIPAAYQPKMFQAFQRLHPAAAKGEGIGLTLIRRLIDRLGGSIWFESTEGIGSTFFVTLPETPTNGTPYPVRSDAAITLEPEQAHDNGTVLHSVG